jgi:hypothetical protein
LCVFRASYGIELADGNHLKPFETKPEEASFSTATSVYTTNLVVGVMAIFQQLRSTPAALIRRKSLNLRPEKAREE